MGSFEAVLSFWFGTLGDDGFATKEVSSQWFSKDPKFDEEIRSRFLDDHKAISANERENWLADPRSLLAYVIVLDQFSRNMFRDAPGMFASDARALAAVEALLTQGGEEALRIQERVFLFMPLMHSESLAVQERCVGSFRALRDSAPAADRHRLEGNCVFAEKHRDIVARFGRFPHRNLILGRTSTPEEVAFLAGPGSSF